MYGDHCLKTSSTVQGPIGLSSGEGEFYACVRGGCYLLGIKSLFEDWGLEIPAALQIQTDSSAAQGFCTRRGLGQQRHVSTRYLWLQDQISKGDLKVRKVLTKDQLADFLTKAMTQKVSHDLAQRIGLRYLDGRSLSQKGALLNDFYSNQP